MKLLRLRVRRHRQRNSLLLGYVLCTPFKKSELRKWQSSQTRGGAARSCVPAEGRAATRTLPKAQHQVSGVGRAGSLAAGGILRGPAGAGAVTKLTLRANGGKAARINPSSHGGLRRLRRVMVHQRLRELMSPRVTRRSLLKGPCVRYQRLNWKAVRLLANSTNNN